MFILLYISYLALGASFAALTPVAGDPLLQLPANDSSSTCPAESACKRSVWDVLWASLTVIFACSWVAIHPHIAPDTKWWRRPLIRLELMAWTIIYPETLVLLATKQAIAAWQLSKTYRDENWTMTHGFFIQMGGFMLYDCGIKQGVLSPERFADLLKTKRITFPKVSKAEIEDRSERDGISKSLVVLQTSWFIIQVAARKLQGLTITQLEVATFAFAALNGVMYLFWWYKPFNVHLPIRIDLRLPPEPKNTNGQSHSATPRSSEAAIEPQLAVTSTANVSHTSDPSESSRIAKAWDARFRIISAHVNYTLQDVPSVPIFFSSEVDLRYRLMAYAISSSQEKYLWRIASVIMVAYPSLFLFQLFLDAVDFLIRKLKEPRSGESADQPWDHPRRHAWTIRAFVAFLPICTAARLLIFVVALLALRNLSESATATVAWTTFLPHI